MNVVGFCGRSGSGKTTLIERLIPLLRASGQRVSVLKHAHHAFDIDHRGKDSWRHREAGAFEVVIASSRRLALVREFEAETELSVHQMVAELSPCDWVFVEGFKYAELPKIEVWRAGIGHPVHYPDDRCVVAIATDSASQLPQATALPVFDLDQADAIARFLLAETRPYAYLPPDPQAAALTR